MLLCWHDSCCLMTKASQVVILVAFIQPHNDCYSQMRDVESYKLLSLEQAHP